MSGKLFGNAAQRISAEEMKLAFQELKNSVGSFFNKFELTRHLPFKQDHGDIDILVLNKPGTDIDEIFKKLGNSVLQHSKNDHTHSFLIHINSINKNVHVDFISSNTEEKYVTNQQYYALNDFSAVVGLVSKKLHFKYGNHGLFKRFQDIKTMWHDIPLPLTLMDGLKIFGFDMSLYSKINTPDDIVSFISSSPLVDASFFEHNNLTAADRQAGNRRFMMNYILNALREKQLVSSIKDEDYFFKKLYPDIYLETEKRKKELDIEKYKRSNIYNGTWLMNNFGIKPGLQVGEMLTKLHKQFGAELENTDEQTIKKFISQLL
jgi:hypothetical protein